MAQDNRNRDQQGTDQTRRQDHVQDDQTREGRGADRGTQQDLPAGGRKDDADLDEMDDDREDDSRMPGEGGGPNRRNSIG